MDEESNRKNRVRGRTRTLRRIIAFAAVPLILLGGFYFAALSWLESLLRQGVQAGACHLRSPGFDAAWNLSFAADSLHASCLSGLRIAASGAEGRFIPLFAGHPGTWGLLELGLDDARLRQVVGPGPATKPSLPRKGLGLPLSFRVSADSFYADPLATPAMRFRDVLLASTGLRSAEFLSSGAASPAWAPLRPSVRAQADWSGKDSLSLSATAAWKGDTARLLARLPRRNLTRYQADLRASLASLRPYAEVWEPLRQAPDFRGADFRAQLVRGDTYRLRLAVEGTASDWRTAPLDSLGPMHLALSLEARDGRGTWSLEGRGQGEGRLGLSGQVTLGLPAVGGAREEPAFRVTASGSAAALPLAAGGKVLETDLRIQDLLAMPDTVGAAFRTGSGSAGRLGAGRDSAGWHGRYHADIAPKEDWVRAFVDGSAFQYGSLAVDGWFQGRHAGFTTRARDVRYRRLVAGSLRARHRLEPGQYRLLDGTWSHGGTDWDIGGGIRWSTEGPSRPAFSFHAFHPQAGTVRVSGTVGGPRHLLAAGLRLNRVPVTGITTARLRSPVVTASVDWSAGGRKGRVAWDASALLDGDSLRADGWGRWTRDSLHLMSLLLDYGGGELRAGLHTARQGPGWPGPPSGLPGSLDRAFLSAEDFPAGRLAGAWLDDASWSGGALAGRIAFHRGRGLRGALDLDSLALPGPWRLASLRADASRDTLLVTARTASARWAAASADWRASLTGLPGPSPEWRLAVRSDSGLAAAAQGRIPSWERIAGNLQVTGKSPLPGIPARIARLELGADFSAPLGPRFLEGLEADGALGEARLRGEEFPAQALSARLRATDGVLRLAPLRLRNLSGDTLAGRLEWTYAGAPGLDARLSGSRYALDLGGSIGLSFRQPSLGIGWRRGRMDAAFRCEACRGEFDRGPIRIMAELYGFRAEYKEGEEGADNAGGHAYPLLSVSGVLKDSYLGYQARDVGELRGFLETVASTAPGGEGGEGGKGIGGAGAEEEEKEPLQIRADIRIEGDTHRLDTRYLDFSYGGTLQASGALPNPVVNGRLAAHRGHLGVKDHEYEIARLALRWPGVPLDEGLVDMEARKSLAADCRPLERDSCEVRLRLEGRATEPRFRYGSDCLPALGPPSDMPALVSSVSKECRQPEYYVGGVGRTYGERILSLFSTLFEADPFRTADGSLELAPESRLHRRNGPGDGWITHRFLPELMYRTADTVATAGALDVSSPELRGGIRYRILSDHLPAPGEFMQPWDQSASLVWPPWTDAWLPSEKWGERLRNHLVLEAAIATERPVPVPQPGGRCRAWMGLGAGMEFWGWPEGEEGK